MRYLLILLVFVSLPVYGQSWFQKGEVEWYSSSDQKKGLKAEDNKSFKYAVMDDEESGKAYFYDRISWDNKPSKLDLSFFSYQSQEIEDANIENNHLSDDIEFHYSLAVESGHTWLQYWFEPIFYNKEKQKAERIISYTLKIESLMVPELLKENQNLFQTGDSPLANGNWYKIRTGESGMYKITYADMKSMGISNPENVRVYGFGGTRLDEDASNGTQDDLSVVSVFMEKGDDELFDDGDFILFYAMGPESWSYNPLDERYRFSKNEYSDYGYYFITSDLETPVLPNVITPVNGEAIYESTSYDILRAHEKDESNFFKSGKEWYGEIFDLTTTRIFNFNFPGLILDQAIELQTNLLSRSKDTASFLIYGNNAFLDRAKIKPAKLSDYTSTYAYASSEKYLFNPGSENVEIKLNYIKSETTDLGWLDFLVLTGRANLAMQTDELLFSDKKVYTKTGVKKYTISNSIAGTRVWNLTQYPLVEEVNTEYSDEKVFFNSEENNLQLYLAFNPDGSFPRPDIEGEGLGKIENQNLHNDSYPDFVIVSHSDFLDAASVLAEYRHDNNDLEVLLTTPEEIYNEFSSGRPDVTAIRNFMRYLYKRAGSDESLMPKYLLLFGDGSFAFKNTGAEEGNFVPTYQSDNSVSPTSSYVSDDFFGLLDDGESMYSGLLDIGIGRLPVKSTYEADYIVEKIIAYEQPEKMGEWRTNICFIGDDEDYNIHLNQANELAGYVEENYPSFNVKKIFLDAFQQETTSKGERYPDVNIAINEQVNKGALIINYTGHGGTNGLAHEKILGVNDIETWDNKDKLPLFMTATCEFSRFDEPDIVSAGERVILNENGGGIALLTTTRLVYSAPNHVMNERFYEIVFDRSENGKNYCLGEIMKYSKNNAGSGYNKRNFTLLGDPAMRLTYPQQKVIADSINSISVSSMQDTIKAFQKVQINGHVEDINNKVLDDFNGLVYPAIYDKESLSSTLGNDGGTTTTFTNRNRIIYKGVASVKDGYFNFSFIIPKDINYSVGMGRLSFYVKNDLTDGAGAFNEIKIGGSQNNIEEDIAGPVVDVFMNDASFKNGGITDDSPVLFVRVNDEHGINTTGNGIGHDITAYLNYENHNEISLNDFYQADQDSYKSGSITYPLFNLEEGRYTVNVKVWDIYNNSSEGSTEFMVVDNQDFLITKLMNFPNPFYESTAFEFEHNRSDTDLDIRVDIYNMQGELLKTISAKEYATGYHSQPIIWEVPGDIGDQNLRGLLMYKIRVRTSEGEEAENSGKMLILK